MSSEDMSLCSEDNNGYIHARPESGVVWRGSFDISNGDTNVKVHKLRAHFSDKACSKVRDAAVKIPELISVEMVPRLHTWPKSFIESPPTDENIAIYIFPEDWSYAEGFNNLLDGIIRGDCALKCVLDDCELLVFTSLQLPEEQRRFQGKIYLWGVFKGKSSPSNLSIDRPPIQSASVNLAATAVESNASCAEQTNNGVSVPTKETNTDIVWEHWKTAGTGKLRVVTCNYCNRSFPGTLGIVRLKDHLAGGHTNWHVNRCPKVPKDVEEAMKETRKVKMKKLIKTGVSEELKGVTQRLEIRKESVVEESQLNDMGTHPHDPDYAVYLKEATVPGSTTSALQEQGPFGGPRRIRVVKPRCRCCVTPKIPTKKTNRCILSGVAATLKTNLDKKISSKRAHECENVEVIHVGGKQKKKVAQKAKKGIPRGAKRVKGITGGSSTSNLPGEAGNAIDQIQQEILMEVPVLSVQQNPEVGEDGNVMDQIQQELPVEVPALFVSQNPELPPAEEVAEPQITNYEVSDQSTDLTFLQTMNKLAKSTGTVSEHTSVVRVDKYTVKHHLRQTLEEIFEKYGDIAQLCPIASISGRSRFLGELCEVLYQLKDIEFPDCGIHHPKSLIDAVERAKEVGLDVSWLDQRCDDLKKVLVGTKNYGALVNDLAKAKAVAESSKESLDLKKADVGRRKLEMEILNGQLALLRVENEDVERKMRDAGVKARRFRRRNLADGLL